MKIFLILFAKIIYLPHVETDKGFIRGFYPVCT